MAAEEDDAAALAALASRGDALFAALRDAHPESCVRASLPVAASSLGDTAAVVRAAAPVALAARRALEALRDAAAAREDEEEEDARSNSPNPRRPPPVIVELCGPEGGHVVGMLLAATLPAGAASEIVLVDRRWPTKRATTVRSRFEVGSNAPDASDARTTSPSAAAAAPFPVAHVDDPALFGGGVPLTRWRAKTTSAGDLRALHASLEATNAAALIVSRRAPGTATLRAAQLFLAPPHTNVEAPPTTRSSTRSRPGSRPAPRALVLEPGDPPDKATALRGKTTYRATRDVLGVVAPRPTTSTSGSEERRTELRTVSFTARDVFARGRSAEDATRAWKALCARAAGARSVNDERYIYAATSDGDDRAARAARAFDALAARAFDALAALEPVGGVRTDFEPTSNPPRGVSSSDASGGGAFGPVALGAADQMAEIVARVAALVDVTRPRKGGRRVRSRFEVGSKNAETTVAIEDASRAAAGKKETRRADDAAEEEEEDVVLDIFLRRSDPSRWTSGGYAAHHYVAADPQPHAACFEAEVAGARVGFVAIGAYGGDGAEALLPLEDEEEEEEEEEEEAGTHASPGGKKERAASDSHLRPPRSTRFLTAAQVDRLCVLPSRRGVGVKEALLRVADAFHALGLPVRLKTASVDATRSLLRCPLLALEGFRDPRTKAGVAKRRGAKIVAVVPRLRSSGIETSSSSRDGDAPLLLRGEENIDELRRAAAASPGDGGRANTRVPTKRGGGPFAAVHAAMNRAAPDTVARSAAAMDAAIDGIVRRGAEEEADGGGADDASASESGVSDASESGVSDARSLVAATIARRASAEPAFADTHAAIVARLADTRVAREIVRATRLRVRNALDGRRSKEARDDPTKSDPASDPRGAAFDPLAPGAARFLAAMASRGVAGADRGVADAKTLAANALRDDGFRVRASASSLLPNAAAEAEAPSGARRTPLDPRAVAAERVEPAPVFVAALEIARALAEGGATLADAVPLDVAKALEAMARRSADDVFCGDEEETTKRRSASAVPSRRAAFLAERVLGVLEAERRASGAAGSGVPGVPDVLRSSNRAMTRAEVHAAFVAEGARRVKSDHPRAEKADAYSRKNGDERDAALVSTSRRVVAVEGSAAAVERGMRRGWVFWYAGSPVVRFPDAKPFVFDAESAAGFHSRERGDADAGSDDDADPRRFRREDGGKRSPSRGPRRRFVPAPVGATWPTEGAVYRV